MVMCVRGLNGDQGFGHPDHRMERLTGGGNRGKTLLLQREGRRPQSLPESMS